MKLKCMSVLLMAVMVAVPVARGLWLDLPKGGEKCVSEMLHSNVVVLGDYSSFFADRYDNENTTYQRTSISVVVTSPHGTELHRNEKSSHGQFAFTTTQAGTYQACFTADADHKDRKITIGLEWKIGIAAKDWDAVAKKEKLQGLELELKKLESSVQYIHEKLMNLIKREAEMRSVSEVTNTRVAAYSITSLSVCIVVAVLQILYLRRYFQNKKLI